MNEDKEPTIDVARRILAELAEMTEHASLTHGLRGGERAAAQAYNRVLATFAASGALPGNMFEPVDPESVEFGSLGVQCRLLLSVVSSSPKPKGEGSDGRALRRGRSPSRPSLTPTTSESMVMERLGESERSGPERPASSRSRRSSTVGCMGQIVRRQHEATQVLPNRRAIPTSRLRRPRRRAPFHVRSRRFPRGDRDPVGTAERRSRADTAPESARITLESLDGSTPPPRPHHRKSRNRDRHAPRGTVVRAVDLTRSSSCKTLWTAAARRRFASATESPRVSARHGSGSLQAVSTRFQRLAIRPILRDQPRGPIRRPVPALDLHRLLLQGACTPRRSAAAP